MSVRARCGPLLFIRCQTTRSLPAGAQVFQTLTGECHTDYVRNLPRDSSHKSIQGGVLKVNMDNKELNIETINV